jgi:NADH dehydrogenase [ubiquinone] 1 alpha subcomplex assembly factor 8
MAGNKRVVSRLLNDHDGWVEDDVRSRASRVSRHASVAGFSSSASVMSSKPAATAVQPLKRLALHSTTTCAAQANAYGQCILATYTDVRKDICKEEFAKFGQCLRQAVCQISV